MAIMDAIEKMFQKDHLSKHSVKEVAEWYIRLAEHIEERVGKGNSLASELLNHWLESREFNEYEFDSKHIKSIKNMEEINDYLIEKVRPVFLTDEKAEFQEKKFWGGIKPRLKRIGKYKDEDPRDEDGNYTMMYESRHYVEPVKIGEFFDICEKYDNNDNLSDVEKKRLDIFTSLHAFALQSHVVVSAKSPLMVLEPNTKSELIIPEYEIEFLKWETNVSDTYNWNFKLGLPVPNPDFKKEFNGAIAPGEKYIVVKHQNAKRVEKAKLAHNYKVLSPRWKVSNNLIIGPATIDISKFRG